MNKEKNQRFFCPSLFPKSRKGQIFTMLAIFLITLMFFSFEIFSIIHERQSIRTRISTMDSFLHSIEKNLERQVYITSFRTIFLANSEIATSGYIFNISAFFQESFYNGTVNGVPKDIMLGANYSDMIASVNNKADKINVEVIMENTTVELVQNDPWNLRVTMISDFIMQDKEGLAKWNKSQNISVLISIQGFEDPIFIVGALAQVPRKINKTIYEGQYVNGADVSNLSDHVDQGYYAANTNAPSFLKRLEGDLSADPNGIESFVKIPQIPVEVQAQKGVKSCVDYIYFSSSNPNDFGVTGMNTWFRIDDIDGHIAKYQVVGLTY